MDTQIFSARETLDLLLKYGVEYAVLSPGSRNAPLLIGAEARKKLKKIITTDERTAAFIALGLAKATQRPVALCCTSGSAVYNYAPAVAEAFYSHIPLIVVTADRPRQWIGQDSQTLPQSGALGGIVKCSVDIPSQHSIQEGDKTQLFENDYEWFVNRRINEAMIAALHGIKGPVHINLQFAAPFNTTIPYKDRKPRKIEIIENLSAPPLHLQRAIAADWMKKKIMVFAGSMLSDNKLNNAVGEFARLGNVCVMTEATSNLHINSWSNSAAAALLSEEIRKNAELRPDVIITLGGLPVSESVKIYIGSLEETEVITSGDIEPTRDTYKNLKKHYDFNPERFISSITSMIRHLCRKGGEITDDNYGKRWERTVKAFQEEQQAALMHHEWGERKAVGIVADKLPSSCNLFLSNGLTVRYAAEYLRETPHNCWANRGVSGIEGTNATALGAAIAYKGTTVLLTGDMSFSYCPEILKTDRYGGDLRVIVIDNKGGGIFRNINATKDLECREEYFCADPGISVRKIAEAYSWNYRKVRNESELADALDFLLNHDKSIIEIKI